MAKAKNISSVPWRNRIVGYGEEEASQLLANPKNWRIHPKNQQAALEGSLDKIGWIQNCVVNRSTGFVIDGHARVALAISRGEKVPCLYVELTPQEEALAIATLDSITALARTDKDILDSLVLDLRGFELDLGDGLEGPLDKHRKQDVDAWLRKLPSVMEGLPQTFELDDQICYRAPDGAVVDGVIVATVTCHEQYVVAPGDSRATAGRQPGDSRATKGEPMYMVCPSMIVKRGETPPLPGKRHETPNS
jgi:hypothetical protein